jgi:hypothetical protein
VTEPKRPGGDAVLFIVMRTDLKSMVPGKAIAQGSHAANAAAKHAEASAPELYRAWSTSTMQHFGTVLVLDGGKSIDAIEDLVAEASAMSAVRGQEAVTGMVFDPTYPVRDGEATHYVPVTTCAYLMCYRDSEAHKVIKQLKLHP